MGMAFSVWPLADLQLLSDAADELLSGSVDASDEQRDELVALARSQVFSGSTDDDDSRAIVDYVLRARHDAASAPEPTVSLTFQQALNGAQLCTQTPRGWRNEYEWIRVPAGVASGQRLRCFRRDDPENFFMLPVQVAEHPVFSRRGDDVVLTVPVAPSDLEGQGPLDVPLARGGTHLLHLPFGAHDGTVVRLRGMGFPDPHDGEDCGHQLHVLNVVPDAALAAAKRAALLDSAASFGQVQQVSPQQPLQ